MPRFLSKIGLNSSAGDLAALTPETVLPVLDRLVLAGAGADFVRYSGRFGAAGGAGSSRCQSGPCRWRLYGRALASELCSASPVARHQELIISGR